MTIVSPSWTAAIGPPRAASGATWPIISPCVPPENRPSVMSATESPRPSPTSAAVTLQHLLHAGAADRTLVADDDHVARLDLPVADGLVAVGLRIEDASRPAMLPSLVAGELHDAAFRGERAVQDGQPAGRLERRLDRANDRLAGRLDGGRGDLGDRPAIDGRGVAVEQARPAQELAHDEAHAAGVVQVRRGVATARLQVGDDRRPVGDGPEFVDVERDAVLVGDRQQVQDAVGRTAGRRHGGDRVLERVAGHEP